MAERESFSALLRERERICGDLEAWAERWRETWRQEFGVNDASDPFAALPPIEDRPAIVEVVVDHPMFSEPVSTIASWHP